jgi:hypothetical protein
LSIVGGSWRNKHFRQQLLPVSILCS